MDGAAIAPYIPSVSLLIFGICTIVAVKEGLAKRPTFKEANKRYKETKVCDEIHKSVTEKLDCIPEMKERQIRMETNLDFLVGKKNGKR